MNKSPITRILHLILIIFGFVLLSACATVEKFETRMEAKKD